MPSPVLELLGKVRPQIQGNPQPNMLVPHVYSFSSLIQTAARVYSYRYDEALRHLPGNALAMRRDAFIDALLQERTTPTAMRNWSIWVPDRKDAYQKKVAQWVTEEVRAIPRFDSMRQYTLEAVWYGRYGSQLNLVQKRVGGRTAWTVGNHMPVNGDKIFFAWDGTPMVAINPLAAGTYPAELLTRHGEPVAVRSDRGMTLLRLERPEYRRQFIIHRHVVNDADYFEPEMGGAVHGVGLRSKIYWAWWLRGEMLGWAVDFMQKVGTLGLLVFMYEDGNPKSQEKAEEAAQKASSEVALTMAMPPGQSTKPTNAVQHIAPNDGGVQALRGMIEEYFEGHIERMFVGQPSSGGTEGNGFGGSAGTALHADTKYQLLRWDARNLDETLTTDLVATLVRLNHSDVDFPVEFRSSVPSPEDAAKLAAIKTAWDMGVTFKMGEVRDLTGMAEPEEGDEVLGGGLEANAAENANPFGNDGGKKEGGDGEPKDDSTDPGQGLTTNAKEKRETGQYADLMAYADDGSVFAPWVDVPGEGKAGGWKVTLARKGREAEGATVFLPHYSTTGEQIEALQKADPSLPAGRADDLLHTFFQRVRGEIS